MPENAISMEMDFEGAREFEVKFMVGNSTFTRFRRPEDERHVDNGELRYSVVGLFTIGTRMVDARWD